MFFTYHLTDGTTHRVNCLSKPDLRGRLKDIISTINDKVDGIYVNEIRIRLTPDIRPYSRIKKTDGMYQDWQ